MITNTILLEILKLPSDVEEPYALTVHGEITGNPSEVVVIEQLGRRIFEDAYVCHMHSGKGGEAIISDMPNFPDISVGAVSTKKVDGVTYTMVCAAEKNLERTSSNWLY